MPPIISHQQRVLREYEHNPTRISLCRDVDSADHVCKPDDVVLDMHCQCVGAVKPKVDFPLLSKSLQRILLDTNFRALLADRTRSRR